MPSSRGIFTSRIDQVGAVLLGQLDGGLPVAGLAHDVVPLLGEHLGEVQADQRLVLGDDDACGGAGVGSRAQASATASGLGAGSGGVGDRGGLASPARNSSTSSRSTRRRDSSVRPPGRSRRARSWLTSACSSRHMVTRRSDSSDQTLLADRLWQPAGPAVGSANLAPRRPGIPTAEKMVSNTIQCGFESHPGHSSACLARRLPVARHVPRDVVRLRAPGAARRRRTRSARQPRPGRQPCCASRLARPRHRADRPPAMLGAATTPTAIAGYAATARLLPRRRLPLRGRRYVTLRVSCDRPSPAIVDDVDDAIAPVHPARRCSACRAPGASSCRATGSTGPACSRSTVPGASTSGRSSWQTGSARSSRHTRPTSCAACSTPTGAGCATGPRGWSPARRSATTTPAGSSSTSPRTSGELCC